MKDLTEVSERERERLGRRERGSRERAERDSGKLCVRTMIADYELVEGSREETFMG